VAPRVLIHAQDLDTVEAGRVGDQQLVAGRQDGVVDGVPDTPSAAAIRAIDIRSMTTLFNAHITACVESFALGAAAADVQDRCPPAERDVRQSAQHAVARHP
jgi:hypothetical protein